jgi:hypothetical protein
LLTSRGEGAIFETPGTLRVVNFAMDISTSGAMVVLPAGLFCEAMIFSSL